MSMRTALNRNPVVSFGVVLFALWVVVQALNVWNAIEWTGGYVGQTAVSGVIGLLVVAGVFGLMLVLYGELGDEGAAPEPFEQ